VTSFYDYEEKEERDKEIAILIRIMDRLRSMAIDHRRYGKYDDVGFLLFTASNLLDKAIEKRDTEE
jgi:hypothetical protein